MEQHLAQYGAVGVLLSVFVVLFVWMFKTLFTRFIQHLDNLTATLNEMVRVLGALKNSVEDNHRDVMERLRHPRREATDP